MVSGGLSMLRYLTAGESHGRALVAVVEGLPSGVPLTPSDIDRDLDRRQEGYGRGGRMKIEKDRATILSGVRHGLTLGSPVTLMIENRDWTNWQEVMNPEPPSGGQPPKREVHHPRPGHADLAGSLKYGFDDARNVLERASARETAARVAAGAVAKSFLRPLGIDLIGLVASIGPVSAELPDKPLEELRDQAEASPVRCPDASASGQMVAEIDRARSDGDSLGGVFEIRVTGLPPGLGSHVSFDRKLDGRLAGALMSIQAVKGVEVGLGFQAAYLRGSQVHDEIFFDPASGFFRKTNGAGGLEGGMTNGEPLVIRGAMKPIATLYRPLATASLLTGEPARASVERSDICAVPAAAVIGEAVVALEIANAITEKFGGDSLGEVLRNFRSYSEELSARWRRIADASRG